jgi:vanillate O-demethylase monooxygenase subunit
MATNDFVRNAWYMAAWAEEVPQGGFLPRKLLGQPWLLWQRSDGEWVMNADRCPHRFVPLSRGKREGDVLRCGYHGLGFDSTGACVLNPFGGDVPPGAKVVTLPVVERHGALWFWPGEADLADPAQIPDFAFVTGPDHVRGVLVMDAGYELIADNLMDLSHAEFLHVETFGVNGALFNYGVQTVEQDETGAIWNKWDMDGSEPPVWAAPMLQPGERIDQWIHIRWHAPATMALFVGLARQDTDRTDFVVPPMSNPHILTPETATSTHYFYTRQPGEESIEMVRRVFLEEDEPMVRAAQDAMDGQDFWDLRPVILASDAAAIRARRRLMQMRRAEAVEA